MLQRLNYATETLLERQRHALTRAVSGLNTLSPLATLTRGYSITRSIDTHNIVRDAAEVAVGARLETLLAKGRVISEVVEKT